MNGATGKFLAVGKDSVGFHVPTMPMGLYAVSGPRSPEQKHVLNVAMRLLTLRVSLDRDFVLGHVPRSATIVNEATSPLKRALGVNAMSWCKTEKGSCTARQPVGEPTGFPDGGPGSGVLIRWNSQDGLEKQWLWMGVLSADGTRRIHTAARAPVRLITLTVDLMTTRMII